MRLGVPLDKVVEQERLPRWVEKEVEGSPGKIEHVLETPKEPVKWPVYVFYFKPRDRAPERRAARGSSWSSTRGCSTGMRPNDWAWFLSLFAAAWGTFLFAFDQTLNNHTIAASSAFFAIYRARADLGRGGTRGRPGSRRPASSPPSRACNELPAALFGILLFVMLAGPVPDDDAPRASSRRPLSPARRSWRRSTSPSASSGRSTRSSGRRVVPVRGELLEHAAGDGLVQRPSRAVARLPAST